MSSKKTFPFDVSLLIIHFANIDMKAFQALRLVNKQCKDIVDNHAIDVWMRALDLTILFIIMKRKNMPILRKAFEYADYVGHIPIPPGVNISIPPIIFAPLADYFTPTINNVSDEDKEILDFLIKGHYICKVDIANQVANIRLLRNKNCEIDLVLPKPYTQWENISIYSIKLENQKPITDIFTSEVIHLGWNINVAYKYDAYDEDNKKYKINALNIKCDIDAVARFSLEELIVCNVAPFKSQYKTKETTFAEGIKALKLKER